MNCLKLPVLIAGLAIGAAGTADAQQRLSIATGQTNGVYYLWGGALAQLWSANIPGVSYNVEATVGQTQNLQLFEAGNLEVAMYNVVTAYESWRQIGDFSDRPYQQQRAVFAMYPSFYVMGALASTGITSIEEWEGRRISLGPAVGTVDVIGRNILDVLGITPGSIANPNWPDVPGQVRDGLVDAFAGIGGQPWPPFVDIGTTHDVVYFDFTDEQRQQVLDTYEYYSLETLPAGTYDSQTEDYNTFGFWNMTFARADLDEEIVYQMLKLTDENAELLLATHPSTARYFDVASVLRVSPVPLHPGAIRYLREIGHEIPDHLIPPEMQ